MAKTIAVCRSYFIVNLGSKHVPRVDAAIMQNNI